ncbi:MAG: hypothetical protein KR126chlam5_00614, partial [Candidatus Anoxychlamydiales bacterium]|nr:hypothetical protein [Candidatus Anoxychlamydiales bacterium]
SKNFLIYKAFKEFEILENSSSIKEILSIKKQN